ncbi:unnamed protein product, partial [Nesidiocoris tenuis]
KGASSHFLSRTSRGPGCRTNALKLDLKWMSLNWIGAKGNIISRTFVTGVQQGQ